MCVTFYLCYITFAWCNIDFLLMGKNCIEFDWIASNIRLYRYCKNWKCTTQFWVAQVFSFEEIENLSLNQYIIRMQFKPWVCVVYFDTCVVYFDTCVVYFDMCGISWLVCSTSINYLEMDNTFFHECGLLYWGDIFFWPPSMVYISLCKAYSWQLNHTWIYKICAVVNQL